MSNVAAGDFWHDLMHMDERLIALPARRVSVRKPAPHSQVLLKNVGQTLEISTQAQDAAPAFL